MDVESRQSIIHSGFFRLKHSVTIFKKFSSHQFGPFPYLKKTQKLRF
jgi:hypothetical protein